MTKSQINLLSQDTIDKIAAGEVVERPSSVVKELVENAIDAGATAVTVEIREGGTSLIRITDNGLGIAAEEIPMAFLRHSTSKIQNAADLHDLHSLGFRGEALSSIAAVSMVEMITKTAGQLTGCRYCMEGGREVSSEEIGAPDGTTIIVRKLFYNTPARKKFLKSPATEGSYVADLLERLALSHPGIAFRLIANGQEKIATSGNGDLKECIYQLYGRDIAGGILPISYQSDFVTLEGWIGEPHIARGNRGFETFFVQDRYVKSRVLSQAAEEGYHGFLMQHQYPFIVCSLHFDASMVDVNVHPTKQEVRFENAKEIFAVLSNVIAERLSMRENIIQVTPEERKESPSVTQAADLSEPPKKERWPEPFEPVRLEKIKKEVARQIASDSPYEPRFQASLASEPEQISFLTPEARRSHRMIGQVFDTYWLVEYDEKLYMIDQHAAHEKVLYEKTLASLKDKEMTSQMISPPVVVSLGAEEQQILEKYHQDFDKMGFSVSSFGGNEYSIDAIPGNIFHIDARELFLSMLAECARLRTELTDQLILEKIATMSCKAAVKGHDHLSFREADALIGELLSLKNPYFCPHGRPTIISMTRQELEKKFKRIVP